MGKLGPENPLDCSSQPPREKVVIGPGPVFPPLTIEGNMGRFPNINYKIFNVGPTSREVEPVPPLTIDDIVIKVAPEIGIPLKDFPLTRLPGPFIKSYLTDQEAKEVNVLTGPFKQSGRLFGVGVVLGLSAVALAACSPAQAQQTAEVRPVEQTKQAPPLETTVDPVSKDVVLAESTPTPPAETPTPPPATETPSPTLTPTPKDTATATASPTTEATKTPEGPKLGNYDAYEIEFENGERGMLTTLPDGKLVMYSNANSPKCGPNNKRLLAGYMVGSFQNQGFNFRTEPDQIVVSGKLTEEGKITGAISGPSFKLMSGGNSYQCPAVKLTYNAIITGTGLDSVLKAYGAFFPAGTPKSQILASFKQWTQIDLLNLPAGK